MTRRDILFALFGFLLGATVVLSTLWLRLHRLEAAQQVQPLKVTIIDSGGAKLKVESTVKEKP